MLVKMVAFSRYLLAMMLVVFAAFPACAEQQCEPTEAFYDATANNALESLTLLHAELKDFNAHAQAAIFDTNGPCYLLNTHVTRDNSFKQYGWSGFDKKASARANEEVSSQIKALLKNGDFSYFDLDLPPLDYKNKGRISSANIAKKVATTQEKIDEIEANLKIYRQCEVEIFNLTQEQSKVEELKEKASSYLSTLNTPQSTTCTCTDDGTLSTCSVIGESPEEESIKDMSCRNLNEYSDDTAFCPTCIIFERVLMADQKLARGSFGVLADALIKLVSLGLLIFIAIQTLMLVTTPSKQSIGSYLTKIVGQGFKVAIAVLILSNPSFLYDLALKPILEGSLDFGMTLTGKQSDIAAAGAKYTKFNTGDNLLSAPFLQKMVGTADAFNAQTAIMPAVGRAMICNAFSHLNWNVIPNIETLLEGFMVIIFGYIISLSVGFYLLDLTLELGFFCCLLPFLVACWPFKITNRYTKVGWNIFMHIFFNYVMLGVVIATINAISQRALSPENDLKTLMNAINTNNFSLLKEMMQVGGMHMLMLIVCCYISLKLLQEVNSLANKFSGGAGFNISPMIGGLAASTIFASTMNGGRSLFKGLGAGAEGLGKLSDASGLTGFVNEKKDNAKNAVSTAFGFNKMKNFASQLGTGVSAVITGKKYKGGDNKNAEAGKDSASSGDKKS